MTTQEKEYLYIDDQNSLNEFCEQASEAPVLALDTEFVRTRTLNADLGLIQAFDGKSLVLIDPLVDLDLEPFWQLLTNEKIVKVLHSCHEDLEVFKIYSNRMPKPLFDTQIAGQFLFQGKVLGFGASVLQEVGIELDKGEARTNWLKRPLSPQQLEYAANDVKYLLPLYHKLSEKLQQQGIDQFNLAEANYKVELKSQPKNLDLLYLDFGNCWQLKPRELAILQELCSWRLDMAKKRNLALGFVVKDASLFAIAQKRPSDLASLKAIPGINPHEIRLHGNAIMTCVERGKAIPLEECPQKVPRLTDYPIYKQAYKQLKQALTKAGEKHKLPIEMLATKKQLNQWIKWKWQLPHAETPDFIASWRSEILAEALNTWDKSFAQVDLND
ncbi:ribonuclease D [Psychrosphaera sp. B3R10]|uniref:Ribonuclease D n=1 Tax=Psychrosphaera algicola TaxID=3023714 RepID=A0ABT5FAB1_9GAMM|nr:MULTISPECIES: ribonuclease D [unclassified Psychrosphaera]MBU2883835.1 ribonuclease D [Psychrosphaera sp. I2R16]MBU2989655.1 ribonuclease D [Psychrosphaera sp. B3R10]MDC2888475.1 ribonuclease D [Psychrosphaera sp. G1-22]MDO6721428.1 ribonuclease D [Psychrosphaera sp. 1_MG-2023]